MHTDVEGEEIMGYWGEGGETWPEHSALASPQAGMSLAP